MTLVVSKVKKLNEGKITINPKILAIKDPTNTIDNSNLERGVNDTLFCI